MSHQNRKERKLRRRQDMITDGNFHSLIYVNIAPLTTGTLHQLPRGDETGLICVRGCQILKIKEQRPLLTDLINKNKPKTLSPA